MTNRTCGVDECDRVEYAKGWCGMHYQRVLKFGEPGPAHAIDRKGQPLHRVEYADVETVCPCGRSFRARAHGSVRRYCSKTCKARYEKRDARAAGYVRPPQPPCSVDGCDKPNQAKGLCSMHRERVLKYGDPNGGRHNTPGEWRPTDQGYLRRSVDSRVELQHRIIMVSHIGRDLLPDETVHHKNGDRSDNRISNLELWSTMQPAGQRVADKLAFALEIIERYADLPADQREVSTEHGHLLKRHPIE